MRINVLDLRADIIISNADGRRTIMEMLGGKYIDEKSGDKNSLSVEKRIEDLAIVCQA
jgi:hypothetical protein